MDEEDVADKAVVEDVANAHNLQPTCRIKRRVAADVATTGVSRSPQEVRAYPGQPATQAAAYSNITKMFANWNACYMCGFDIEDGHTSATCPRGWRKANHQEGFD